MNNQVKNIIIMVLCLIIVGTAGLTVYTLSSGRQAGQEPNPNVTIIAAPDQTDFEEHPEWIMPEPESIDYGENLALGKEVQQNGQTQIYHCKNAVDGNRYTYWEGKADAYPSEITVNLGEIMELGGAQILLSPNQIWSTRTQEVEIQVSDNGEGFNPVFPCAELRFDPAENGNAAYIPFPDAVQGQYVRFRFFSNTEATAGQAAEIEIYAPQG